MTRQTTNERPARPGEICTCGRPAVVVYITERFGDVPYCGIPAGPEIEDFWFERCSAVTKQRDDAERRIHHALSLYDERYERFEDPDDALDALARILRGEEGDDAG